MRTFAQQPRTPAIDQNRLADDLATGRIGPRGALLLIGKAYGLPDVCPADLYSPIDPVMQLTTSDFADLLENVAGKFIVPAAVDAIAPQWKKWAGQSSIGRLNGSAVVMTPVLDLPTIDQGGNYLPVQPTDDSTDVTLASRGGYCDFSWELLQNDDLGILKNSLANLRNAAYVTQDSVAVDALLAASLSTSPATSVIGSPTAARIDGMRTVLAAKENADGTRLNTRAAIVLCPVSLASQAAVACFEWNAVSDEKLTVIAEPRLDANSVVKWYVLASPAVLPVVTMTFLNGQSEPTLQRLDIHDGVRFFVKNTLAGTAVNLAGGLVNAGV